MVVFPHNAPIILSDNDFVAYGGATGTTTLNQRKAAYLIAETQMSNYLGTFLLPTITTGTFDYHPGLSMIVTDYGMVSQVLRADIVDKDNNVLHLITGSSRYIYIDKDSYGYLRVSDYSYAMCGSPYPCGWSSDFPVKFRVTYEAGLPTGTANHPSIMLGLTMAAQISLNEIAYPSANEGVGDIGITSFSSMDYSEKRMLLKNTAFGNSAKANKIVQLVDNSGIKKFKKALVL